MLVAVVLFPELPAVTVGAVGKTDPPDVLDRQKCLAALAEQRRTKWFQVRFRLRISASCISRSIDDLKKLHNINLH